jgi:uncharacterized protein
VLSLAFFPIALVEVGMPLSAYCKIYDLPDDPKQVMLFSTRTTAVVHIHREVLEDLEKDRLDEEEKATLSELGFLVESVDAEKREMLGFIDESNDEDSTFTAVVILNLDCNLACTYCFEGRRKGAFYMSADTADDFLGFLQSGVLIGKDEIHLAFYGGEPLLSMDTIVRISEGVKTIAAPQGMEYGFSLVTNGTLLTPRAVDELKRLGLTAASVTLDGPRRVHDAFRPFKSGNGSFNAIVRNVKEVCSLIDVQLGGNYTKGHYREFPGLLDHLLSSGITPDKISFVKFDPVINESNEFAPPDFHDGCMSINEPWLFEASIFLREEILKRGFRTQAIEPVVCFMERPASVVVNYDGALYRCPGLIGRNEFCAGLVKSGMLDCRHSHCLENWKNEECLTCGYLPLCFGGCRYMQLLSTGRMNGVNCRKRFLDATLFAFASQDVKYQV